MAAASVDYEDAPAVPPPPRGADASEAAAGLLSADDPAAAMPPLAATVGGLVAEAHSAQLAAEEALRAESGEAQARAIEHIPAVQYMRSRINAARTAEALLRLENSQLRQELAHWRDTASRVAAHEARAAELLASQPGSAPAAAAPAATPAALVQGASALEEYQTYIMPVQADVLPRYGLEAQPVSHASMTSALELLLLPSVAGALVLLCWWRGRGAAAGKASSSSRPEARPISEAAPARPSGRAAGDYGAGDYGAAGECGTHGAAAETPGAPEGDSVTELLRATARELGRGAGLSPCLVEVSDIQLSNVVTGGDVYVSLQVGEGELICTEAVRRPEGRLARFSAALTLEVWRFGGPLLLRVVDRFPGRESTAAQLELPARELLGLAEREDRGLMSFELVRPGAASAEPRPPSGRQPQLSLRLRALPGSCTKAPSGKGFVDEEDQAPGQGV